MRGSFIRALLRACQQDRRIVLLTGDLGFGMLDEFRERCPDQLFNVGVAEQNLAGVAAGLAMSGHVVFTYSIGNFPTLRCLEQIRNDICYHGATVKIVAVGGGLAYGALGFSHFAIEDLAIMRALPGLTVVAPGDPYEVDRLVPQIIDRPGPVYLRLGRAGEQRQHTDGSHIVLDRLAQVREGSEVLLLSTGGMLPVVVDAARMLADDDIDAAVVSVHTLKPLDGAGLRALASRFRVTVTCEEHSVVGGLGGAVAEVLLEAGIETRFRRFGLPAEFPRGVGSPEHLRAENGLDAGALHRLVQSLVRARHPDVRSLIT